MAAGTAGLMLMTTGCGGSSGGKVAQLGSTTTASHGSSGASAASTQGSGWLAFADCMRAHRVAGYPDPGTDGRPPKETLQQLGVSSSRFQSAQSACRHLLPNGGGPPNAAERRQVAAQSLRFSRCVRSHGVPNFPDPDDTGRIPDPGFGRRRSGVAEVPGGEPGVSAIQAALHAVELGVRRVGQDRFR